MNGFCILETIKRQLRADQYVYLRDALNVDGNMEAHSYFKVKPAPEPEPSKSNQNPNSNFTVKPQPEL